MSTTQEEKLTAADVEGLLIKCPFCGTLVPPKVTKKGTMNIVCPFCDTRIFLNSKKSWDVALEWAKQDTAEAQSKG
jgi:DNA-directed RNA polymerase subunit RPC12/RpoP